MNLTSFDTFVAIIETGSLARAAEKLHVSQSTVTTRLQALEAELRAQLLVRTKAGVELTEAGRRFLPHAQTMLELWRQASEDVALPTEVDVVCSIGCHVDLWDGPGRSLFDVIRADHPTAALTVMPGDHVELERLLRSGRVDIALTYEASVQHNQTVLPLLTERLLLVSDRPDSPIRFDPKYIFVESGEHFRQTHAAAYADAGTARISFGRARWALDHLLQNGGSAYLPERLVAAHVKSGLLHCLADAPEFTRNAYLVLSERAANWSWLPQILSTSGDRG